MSILVICPGCKAQFRVGDQNAGKTGPCPKCKAQITVPKPEEVKIHVPEEFASGGKTATGQLVTKPIKREKNKLSPVVLVAVAGGTLLTLALTWLLGEVIRGNPILLGVGTLLVAFPVALAGYLVLRDDELEPYRGVSLWIRVSICAVIYAALWLGFSFVPDDFRAQGWYWLFIAPPFLIVGTAVAWAAFDMSPENAACHYVFFVLVTLLLRWAAGMPAIWNVAATAASAVGGMGPGAPY